MFSYIKKLQYPINIKNPDPRAASIIISQYGGRHCSYYSHFHQPNLTKRPGDYTPGYFYAHFCYFRGVGGVLR